MRVMTAAVESEGNESLPKQKASFCDKRNLTHKRLERWIRLQQFVYGLPDDYSYAIRTSEVNGKSVSRTLVRVGWMTWYGEGRGADRQHSLAISLLDTTEAISGNSTRVFFHNIKKWAFRNARRFLGTRELAPRASMSEASATNESNELMAG